MSKRNTADHFLDAARERVLAVGVRRTTFSDVARSAGVSRMTLYRSFPDVDSLLGALLTRELGGLIERVNASAEPLPTGRERLVEAMVSGAEQMATNPLLMRVLDVDPELLLPYITDRLGGTQRIAMGFYDRLIADGQDDESIQPGDPRTLAYCLQVAAQGFILSVRVAEAEGLREQSFEGLRELLDAYLRPAG